MCKVSVIVPVYNVEKFLVRCLESLVNQTLKDIEIICIDDGSKDNSLNILREYSYIDKRITIVSTANLGPSNARNTGVSLAKGEYLGFVDSDDWVDLDFFEKLYNAAIRYNAHIAVAGIIRLSYFRRKFLLKYDDIVFSSEVNKNFEFCDVPDKNYIWNKIYKRQAWMSLNLSFPEGVFYEDIILTPQLLYYLKTLVVVPYTFYYYWRTPNSIVTQKSKVHKQNFLMANMLAQNFMDEHNIDVSLHRTTVQCFRILGITLFKIRRKGTQKQYILFNVFKFSIS